MKHTVSMTALAVLCGAALAADGAAARDLTYASYVSATHTTHAHGVKPFTDKLRELSDGRINYEIFVGGAMGGPKELLGNVRNGVVDSAGIVDVYTKADLPVNTLISGLLVVPTDSLVVTGAMNELQNLHCPSCVEERKKHNMIGFSWNAVAPYHMLCKEKVETKADMAGKKFRATSRHGVLVQNMGGTPVSITTAEMYEAMQRGQVDCSLGSTAWLDTYNLKDTVGYVSTTVLGAYFGTNNFNMNIRTWNGLSAEDQQLIKDNLAWLVSNITISYLEDADNAVAAAQKNGLQTGELDDELQQILRETRAGEYEEAIKAGEEAGIENAREIIETFQRLMEKWEGIVAETGRDKAKYEEALQREIFSKI